MQPVMGVSEPGNVGNSPGVDKLHKTKLDDFSMSIALRMRDRHSSPAAADGFLGASLLVEGRGVEHFCWHVDVGARPGIL